MASLPVSPLVEYDGAVAVLEHFSQIRSYQQVLHSEPARPLLRQGPTRRATRWNPRNE